MSENYSVAIGKTRYTHAKKMNLNADLTSYMKINSK